MDEAFSAKNDISGIEHVIKEIKMDDEVSEGWTSYSSLALIYIDSGLTSKVENNLKTNSHKDFSAFQHLITLYGK